ncbi:alpha/beta hydrolase [Streptomyces caeruleatus]|uniref:alpha/beta hydrolase n=1 Tax=Streptomyces caeruleatus TaxID=661399 RepID=UPI00131DFE90|nr:alpha/beta hydrolase fold domain-containing protein [Streptomyces caeruleatus]
MADTVPRLALDDTRRALALVRERSAEWHLNTDRIGVIGFSAGGFLTTNAAARG